MKFIKYQALGNDYLVYDEPGELPLQTSEISRICDRHYGIGADGIMVLADRKSDGFGLRIVNPDGSIAEKSGNGLRIFSRYLWDRGYVGEREFSIFTPGGAVSSRVSADGRRVEVAMGRANFSSAAVPVEVAADRALDVPVTIHGQLLRINAVSMGNPHCVTFMDHVDADIAKQLGPELERHRLFTRRTNVQFVKVIDRKNIQVEIWERGAGYTLSSGTSSCAAVAVSRLYDYCDDEVCVHMPGGQLNIRVGNNYDVTMRGAVQLVGSVDIAPECLLID